MSLGFLVDFLTEVNFLIDIPIFLFLSVFDGVLQEFSNRFQDFERISDTTRLVANPHLVETEIAPLNL